jgi:hypothetical protein
VSANGQAVNSGGLLAGLTKESQVNANTGTATGVRAVQDQAKSMLYANKANMAHGLAKQNAETKGQRIGQKEQMAQAWSQAQMQRYKSLSQQRSQQSTLAQKLLEEQIGMNSQWQASLIGMMS